MFKKVYKRVCTILALSLSIMCVSSLPVFASTNTEQFDSTTKLTTTTNSIIDGQPINETLTGVKTYKINVGDLDQREIMIGSSAPIKTLLMSTSLPNLMTYDSGFYRIASKISWHFLPGFEYQLLVIPQDTSTPTYVSISMNKGGSSSWINYGSYTIKEANILSGKQAEIYDVQFPTYGRYKIKVETNLTTLVAAVQSSFGYNNSVIVQGSAEFVIDAQATGYQNDYNIILFNISDDTSSGGAYTVTIEKIG